MLNFLLNFSKINKIKKVTWYIRFWYLNACSYLSSFLALPFYSFFFWKLCTYSTECYGTYTPWVDECYEIAVSIYRDQNLPSNASETEQQRESKFYSLCHVCPNHLGYIPGFWYLIFQLATFSYCLHCLSRTLNSLVWLEQRLNTCYALIACWKIVILTSL